MQHSRVGLYPVLVHRAAILLHASFRPRLTATPLRFASPSPPSGWAEDFHLQAVEHARRTRKKARRWAGPQRSDQGASGLGRAAALIGVALGLDGPSGFISRAHRQLGDALVGVDHLLQGVAS